MFLDVSPPVRSPRSVLVPTCPVIMAAPPWKDEQRPGPTQTVGRSSKAGRRRGEDASVDRYSGNAPTIPLFTLLFPCRFNIDPSPTTSTRGTVSRKNVSSVSFRDTFPSDRTEVASTVSPNEPKAILHRRPGSRTTIHRSRRCPRNPPSSATRDTVLVRSNGTQQLLGHGQPNRWPAVYGSLGGDVPRSSSIPALR